MSTFRADLVAGITMMMNAFIAANPTLLVRHFRSRPASLLTDTPFSFLELGNEAIHWDSSLRDSNVTATIYLIDRLTESGETSDRFDILVDAFRDHLDSYGHIIAGSVFSDAQIGSVETLQLSTDTYIGGVPVVIGPIEVAPGRNP